MIGAIENLVLLECKNKNCGKDFLADGNAKAIDTRCEHCGSNDFEHISTFGRAIISTFSFTKNRKKIK